MNSELHESDNAVILISDDLFVGSQLTGVAQMMGCQLKQVSGSPTADQLQACRLVVMDLSSVAVDLIERYVAACRTADVSVIAFGPHVHAQKLKQAAQVGCDRVVTRGAIVGEVRAALTRC